MTSPFVLANMNRDQALMTVMRQNFTLFYNTMEAALTHFDLRIVWWGMLFALRHAKFLCPWLMDPDQTHPDLLPQIPMITAIRRALFALSLTHQRRKPSGQPDNTLGSPKPIEPENRPPARIQRVSTIPLGFLEQFLLKQLEKYEDLGAGLTDDPHNELADSILTGVEAFENLPEAEQEKIIEASVEKGRLHQLAERQKRELAAQKAAALAAEALPPEVLAFSEKFHEGAEVHLAQAESEAGPLEISIEAPECGSEPELEAMSDVEIRRQYGLFGEIARKGFVPAAFTPEARAAKEAAMFKRHLETCRSPFCPVCNLVESERPPPDE